MNTIAIIMSVFSWFGFMKEEPKEPEYFLARITFYCAAEDPKWGSQTASGIRAKAGTTVAACRSVDFGTEYVIPRLKEQGWTGDSDGVFVVQDRGPAVCKKTASKGVYPVIDVYVSSRREMNRLAGKSENIFKVYKQEVSKN